MRHEPITNRDVQYSSRQGTILPAPRITQLQIPSNEVTYFGRDATVVPNNILDSQVAARFYQSRQREQSHFSEESYSVRNPFRHKNVSLLFFRTRNYYKTKLNLMWNNSLSVLCISNWVKSNSFYSCSCFLSIICHLQMRSCLWCNLKLTSQATVSTLKPFATAICTSWCSAAHLLGIQLQVRVSATIGTNDATMKQ